MVLAEIVIVAYFSWRDFLSLEGLHQVVVCKKLCLVFLRSRL